nr:putative endoglucanase [uncultured bacterium]
MNTVSARRAFLKGRRSVVGGLLGVLAWACNKPGVSQQPATPATAPSAAVAAPGGDHNLLQASDFDDGVSAPWTTSFTAPASGVAEVKDGAYCVTVQNKGDKRWDAQFRHREMVIQKGHTYTISFKGWSSAPTKARPKVGMAGPPYAEYWSSTIEFDPTPKTYVGKFTMMQEDDATAELAFHIGGDMALAPTPFTICIDDIHLDDPEFQPPTRASRRVVPKVLVNQVGYLPKAAKIATYKSDATEPQRWELRDASGKTVGSGQTQVFGPDGASGDSVHRIDFSEFKTEGTGYRLVVGGDESDPFDIAPNLYSKLKYDALAYFYHNRSGIEITLPYAGDRSLTRPAGHLSDKRVPCKRGSGCDYTLDVAGGWYDAGDHGKYVVNGGISVWTLLDWYERTEALGRSLPDFGDGKLSIPERENGVPDLLDEARWELEFFLKMQVPDGQPLAGMVHHKIHDDAWTGLGTAPHEDHQPRSLHPPSTAATLNAAATLAMAARIYARYDAAFAKRCLAAAERAFAAAKQNPSLLVTHTTDEGGGTYADGTVDDEFYWAAAELFVTTGKPEYKQAVTSSKLHARFPTEAGGHRSSMNWSTTDALGMISMALARSHVDAGLRKTLRARIVQAADGYAKIVEREGYGTPLERTADGKYIWGSNSFVLNNMIVLALAYDFTKQPKYLNAVVSGMDYLLGRNPLGQSYVTGYGDRPLQNPHHRFWAHQANAKYPKAPPGVVSGGPNSTIDDPYSKGAGLVGCIAAKCFVDHIEAWSVNEITINWNAPFAWVTAWLDEVGR